MSADSQSPMDNPYRPPRKDADVIPVRRSIGVFRIAASFSVDGHEVDTRFDVLSGNEQCLVDGRQVSARKAPLDFRTSHAFELGSVGRRVVVSCRFWPLFPVRVTLDDRLLVDDLFPGHRTTWLALSIAAGLAASTLLFLLFR
jgi:hypothetical protein